MRVVWEVPEQPERAHPSVPEVETLSSLSHRFCEVRISETFQTSSSFLENPNTMTDIDAEPKPKEKSNPSSSFSLGIQNPETSSTSKSTSREVRIYSLTSTALKKRISRPLSLGQNDSYQIKEEKREREE